MITIGERIKTARLASGMSQRALAEVAGVSAQAISKYERGMDIPGSMVLISLAKVFKVRTEFFFRPASAVVTMPTFRTCSPLKKKEETRILGQVAEWVERYIEAENLFTGGPGRGFKHPKGLPREVDSLDGVENIAEQVREAWNLGSGPIDNIIEALEDNGIRVGLFDGPEGFDSCILLANGSPVIVVNKEVPGDRQRFSLAHELGHLFIMTSGDIDPEETANRFAGAFLVPRNAALSKLGRNRKRIGISELSILKHESKMSMQAWIHRAGELGIISESKAKGQLREFKENEWNIKEPGEQVKAEEPERMNLLIWRALAEDIISESRAAELMGIPLDQFLREEPG